MSDLYVGLDISKLELEVAFNHSHKNEVHLRTPEGLAALALRLQTLTPALVVCEATGGYEKNVAETLEEAGLLVAVVNPRTVRDFARALGILAKTDRLDAKVLARYGQCLQPDPRQKISEAESELKELMVRRDQLLQMIQEEKNRLSRSSMKIRSSIEQVIEHLRKQLKEIELRINHHINKNSMLSDKAEVLRSAPGLGPIGVSALLAFLPELGTLSRQEVAALAGVAPLNRDSGSFQGRRVIWGGRQRLRKILYMVAIASLRVNPVIKEYYLRLKERGKKPKQALVACMRKLLVIFNSMVKNNRPWLLKNT